MVFGRHDIGRPLGRQGIQPHCGPYSETKTGLGVCTGELYDAKNRARIVNKGSLLWQDSKSEWPEPYSVLWERNQKESSDESHPR